ncbi:aminopeptidase [Nibribacter ruber]|uniref:Aminopeptidase N n=1 Tax=Nibribacter ruber TaxID=2698458 RepID=A0A6P1NZA4_9BACT|nr:M1 family metallopeptidase [Nibribacter ruber]QHL86253.1 aminopeptidase [Nibribacter ruber]
MSQTISSTIQPNQDPHSFSKPQEAVLKHVDWDLTIDFDKQQITGTGVYRLEHSQRLEVILDVKDLTILWVKLDDAPSEEEFTLSAPVKHLGQALRIPIQKHTRTVTIAFETTPQAAALQWLAPEQTAGKVHPFLFTQSQAILARTWLPCQDSPSVRFTYTAKVKVPSHLLPLMSADNPQQKNANGEYLFQMDQPIPSYLLSLAVGNLEFAPVGHRCGVYAEPETLPDATYEFADTEKMLEAAEALYGPYLWGRYDLLVLPPSFPFGGMENPKLTFATPTIIAKDRSLTSLIAHELAHSWSGNLVTNATWNDFWLNEGFTVYFERRIMEALYGHDYAEMLHTLGYQDLQHTLQELAATPQDTCLKLQLEGRDPDEGLTEIAYEKGNYFLRHIEQQVGRQRFDQFVKNYFSTYKFQSMDTTHFLEILEKELINGDEALREKINANAWVYTPGIPEGVEAPHAAAFDRIREQLQHWKEGTPPAALHTQDWSTHEWLYFLRGLGPNLTKDKMQELDQAYSFTQSGNSEIVAVWLQHAIENDYAPANARLEEFLTHVGRRKFLVPLYKALLEKPDGRQRAKAIYEKARPNYHAVATSTIDDMLQK